jgi:hypothetical protein
MSLGIYRTTEDGNQRVLENSSDLRVTENYLEAEASLTASGVGVFTAGLVLPASVSVSASSTLEASAALNAIAAILISNTSSLQASVDRTTRGEVDLIASGTMVAMPTFKGSAISDLVASSTLDANARTVKFVSVVSGNVEFERILESEDARITEDGDIRITHAIQTNIINSSMVASANLIPFNSIAYVKRNGVWKQVISISTNQSSTWDSSQKIYRNTAGKWKRIY